MPKDSPEDDLPEEDLPEEDLPEKDSLEEGDETSAPAADAGDDSAGSREPRGPAGPRNNTQQEVGYLRRLIEQHTPVTVKIRGGETVEGILEYYDSSFIRLTRQGQSNLFIFKKDILYLSEGTPLEETPPSDAAAS